MLKIFQNPNKEEFEYITDCVIENAGYCPCAVFQNEDTKCICKEFRDQAKEGFCRCKRYLKKEV